MAVLRGHEIRLDEIGAELDRQGIALQRVRRQIAVRAAMADHQGPRKFVLLAVATRVRLDGRVKDRAEHGRQQSACNGSEFHRPLLK